jgi:8-amino-7-oxononanoate synthase
VIELAARLDELKALGLYRRTRRVSGPQGPHVVLDGKPVLLLCSNNYLGLADHPRVRAAAADAAMRWGVGAGASRLVSGTMTIHRRLEERLAEFKGRETALLFGSGYLANTGVVSALARPGDVVFSDELNHASIIDGCRLSRAETFVYAHRDVEHLAWGIAQAEGRGALIVTDSVFSMDGDVAPLQELVELARRHRIRLAVDEAHATGTLGPDGRGALAEAGIEDQVDVIVGTLGKALGSYGAFVACDRQMASYLVNSVRTFIFSTAPPPPAVAGALAAVELLHERPRRVQKLESNVDALRSELGREGFDVGGSRTQIIPVVVGDPALAVEICENALARGVFAQAIRPPTVPPMTSRLRLAVMASHRAGELRTAARILAQASRAAGFEPRGHPATGVALGIDGDQYPPLPEAAPAARGGASAPIKTSEAPPAPVAGVFDFEDEPGSAAEFEKSGSGGVFDFEHDSSAARAA